MVPVLDKDKKPLMPCSERRAKNLMENGRAKPYWCKGIFCIILQDVPKSRYIQDVVIGIDPGSKFNGYTVKSEAHTLLNLQVNAIDWVKDKVTERAALRKSRRNHNLPYRKCRFNRGVYSILPPSTKSRWQQHLNFINFISKMFNLSCVAIEDICAKTIKGVRKWNLNFSPLEAGKNWFDDQIKSLNYKLFKYKGFDTYQMRNENNLKKNSKKDTKCFYTHCIDSFCIATQTIGGNFKPDNTFVKYLKPLKYFRRKLHEILPKKGDFRKNYGGTLSIGIKRGTLVRHLKYGTCLVGGSSKGRVSLHRLTDNLRLTQTVKTSEIKILTNLKWNTA